MITKLKFILLLLLSFSLNVQGADISEKDLHSEIKEVTVFLKGAQVKRIASVSLEKGLNKLIFSKIPMGLNPLSIMVKGEGNFVILSVSHEQVYKEELPMEEKEKRAAEIVVELEKLFAEKGVESKLFTVLQHEENLILGNNRVAGQQNGMRVTDLIQIADFYRERLKKLMYEKMEHSDKINVLSKKIIDLRKELTLLNAIQSETSYHIIAEVKTERETEGTFEISYLVYNAGWSPAYDLRVKDVESKIELEYYANVHQFTGESWKNVQLTLSTSDPNQSGIKPELKPWYITKNQMQMSSRKNVSYIINQHNNNEAATLKTIKGVVYDQETKEPIPFATIKISGTNVGATTDISGNFKINNPTGAKGNLEANYVGYDRRIIPMQEGTTNIAMNQSQVVLESVTISAEPNSVQHTTMERQMVPRQSISVITQGKSMPLSVLKRKWALKLPNVNVSGGRGRVKAQPVLTRVKEHPTNVVFEIDEPYTVMNDGKSHKVEIRNYAMDAYFRYAAVPKLDPDAFLLASIAGWEEYDLLKGSANVFFEGTFLGKTLINPYAAGDTLELSLGRDKNVSIVRNKVKDLNKKTFLGGTRISENAYEIEIRNNKRNKISLIIEDQFPLSKDEEIQIEYVNYEDAQLEEKTGLLTWEYVIEPKGTKTAVFKYKIKYPKKYRLLLNQQ